MSLMVRIRPGCDTICGTCKVYQLNMNTRPNIKYLLAIKDTTATPWEKVYLDIIGPLPVTETSMKYVLTCQDNLSKYFIAYLCKV